MTCSRSGSTARPRPARAVAAALLVSLAAGLPAQRAGGAAGQSPAPGGAAVAPLSWLERGAMLLEREDPVGAWQAFRRAAAAPPPAPADRSGPDAQIGLGQAHLMLGNSRLAIAYAEEAIAAAPAHQDAMALCVRALIRAREFDDAVQRAAAFVQRTPDAGAELLAARGSALFRVQHTADAAAAYREVIRLDPRHPEAHLRLGSGLLDPCEVRIPPELRLAVGALAAGERDRAVELLQRVLASAPGHPIAHRLLGETLFAERTAASMALADPAFRALEAALPTPSVEGLPIAEFVPGYRQLSKVRRRVVERTAALFRGQLRKLVAAGGRHDLLHELERTTDAEGRANLRGRRTFDGRVWDDVRGVGGIEAATGIEALDEAATFGFDTFAHEVAHQVHFFALTPLERARIRSLYRQAMAERRCLDYYAASNEAEYFGQGVEAFVSLGKRPACETTHGHTRFELLRVDPELHAFIAGLVDYDPLADLARRDGVLAAAVAVALRCGRPADATAAASLLAPGRLRDELAAAARVADELLRCH